MEAMMKLSKHTVEGWFVVFRGGCLICIWFLLRARRDARSTNRSKLTRVEPLSMRLEPSVRLLFIRGGNMISTSGFTPLLWLVPVITLAIQFTFTQ